MYLTCLFILYQYQRLPPPIEGTLLSRFDQVLTNLWGPNKRSGKVNPNDKNAIKLLVMAWNANVLPAGFNGGKTAFQLCAVMINHKGKRETIAPDIDWQRMKKYEPPKDLVNLIQTDKILRMIRDEVYQSCLKSLMLGADYWAMTNPNQAAASHAGHRANSDRAARDRQVSALQELGLRESLGLVPSFSCSVGEMDQCYSYPLAYHFFMCFYDLWVGGTLTEDLEGTHFNAITGYLLNASFDKVRVHVKYLKQNSVIKKNFSKYYKHESCASKEQLVQLRNLYSDYKEKMKSQIDLLLKKVSQ